MSECNIRLQGKIEKYKQAPTSLVYDYRVSGDAARLYEIMLDFQYKQAFVSGELLARKMLSPKGEPASLSKIRRLIRELKQTGWLCVEEQRVYHKDTGAVKTIAEYVLFAQSASAPKSNKELLEEQAAEIAREQAELAEYEGYQPSIGGGFDNIAAELEEQIATGIIAPIPISEAVQEQAAEVVAVPNELQAMIDWAEAKLGHEFSEYYKQAIARTYASDKAGARGMLNAIVSKELAAK